MNTLDEPTLSFKFLSITFTYGSTERLPFGFELSISLLLFWLYGPALSTISFFPELTYEDDNDALMRSSFKTFC
jgi:hypothetical protein